MGLQTSDFKSPLIVDGLPLWKGRIRATKDGQVRGPQSPQCCDILATLGGLQELGEPCNFWDGADPWQLWGLPAPTLMGLSTLCPPRSTHPLNSQSTFSLLQGMHSM